MPLRSGSRWLSLAPVLAPVLAFVLALGACGGVKSGGQRDPDDQYMEVNTQQDARAVHEEIRKLTTTPEKIKGNPEFKIVDTSAVPYVPEYRIGPGDVLEVVYHIHYEKTPDAYRIEVQDRVSITLPFNPQFSTTALVRSDGRASLPLVGEVVMAGRTVSDVTADLTGRFSQFIKNPTVNVALEEFNVKIEELKRSITTASRGQSKIAPVTPDGKVTFPLIGTVQAAGMTVKELEAHISKRYTDFVRNLQVNLILLEIHSNRLFILGEVNVPGVYEMPDRYNLLQALAQAGGIKNSADLSNVLVFRQSNLERPLVYKVNMQNMFDKGFLYRNLFVQQGDVVFVPKGALDEANEIIAKVFTRGIWAIIPFTAGASYGYSYQTGPNASSTTGTTGTTATNAAAAATAVTTSPLAAPFIGR